MLTWTVRKALPAGTAPFFHFESDGKLTFQGGADGTPQGAWAKPGTVKGGCAFGIPQEVRGKKLAVYAR
jgi:hypothetical protein